MLVRSRTGSAVVALCAGCLAAAPGSAPAATVQLAPPDDDPYGRGWASIAYRAAPGEANRVVLEQVDPYTIRVTDPGAVIAPGGGCRALEAHSAECSVAGMPAVNGLIGAQVHAGDLDDVVDSQGPGLSADGGPGDDTLQSSSIASGTLDGGGGRDTLLGGRNQDTLIDGDATGAADADVLDGREGSAIVSYAARTAPIVVDLSGPGLGGEAGERDVIRGARGVVGGSASDTLTGDVGSNWLEGGPGRDRLAGGAGGDRLEGGAGPDRLLAGEGMDVVEGGRGADVATGGAGVDFLDGGRGRDRLRAGAGGDYVSSGDASCGGGLDQVRPADGDFVARDCEQAVFELALTRDEFADGKSVEAEPYPVVRRSGTLVFRLRCPSTSTDGYPSLVPIRGVLRLRTPSGRVVARGRIAPASCRSEDFDEYTDPLPIVRIALRPRGALPRRVTVGFSGRNVPPVRWRIRLPSG